MRTVNFLVVVLVCFTVTAITGCTDEVRDLKIQNKTQQKRIAELQSQLTAIELDRDQLKRKLATADQRSNTEKDALKQQLAAIEEDINKKNALIKSMQQQLLFGGAQLPVELSAMLQDFAQSQDMVTYDSAKGVVKFKSDLLFRSGSDLVITDAEKAVTILCTILNSPQAKKFDIIIAGHTDDVPIRKPATRQKHPTNWHLSAHRAISVLKIMAKNKVASERLSVRGFGQFRPVAPNKPKKRGNPQNRRVEIYIVAKGV